MLYRSTRNRDLKVGLREAVMQGMPADGGLYMPLSIPRLPPAFFHGLARLDFPATALAVARHLFSGDLPPAALEAIVDAAFSFPVPLVSLQENVQVLELFHGPTLAFKDFGARFQSRLLAHFQRGADREMLILVATSGDTGSAVASGFYRVPGIRVVILYPAGKISLLQEQQIATLGGNICALEVEGVFDDCQRLVKSAFADRETRSRLLLTSANSINVARLLPQSFYYFHAWSRLPESGEKIVVSVPCGNFGNLTAGLIAARMGLPVARYVASTNINAVVPDYLQTGEYKPRQSQPTISNAMDVGDPSNFERILDLYGHNWPEMRRDILGFSFSDEQTRATIRSLYRSFGYAADPHGAVALAGLQEFFRLHPSGYRGIALETAHPAKFPEVVEPLIGRKLDLPASLRQAQQGKKLSTKISGRYQDFRDFLWQVCR